MSSADVPEVRSKSLLSDDTLAALQLARQPFARDPDAANDAEVELFADDITAEQLADVRHALITGDDLLLVLGEEGAGKSALLTQLAANSGLRIQCFSVNGGPRFSTRNLFVGMLEAFKVRPPDNLKATLDELIPCLQAMIGNNTLCVVVLDDADKVSEAELTMLLSGMLYLNRSDESLLRVAFAAPSAFEERIPDLLPEGADLPYSSLMLDPFDDDRAGRYLGYLLQQASENPRAADTAVFDDEAIAALNDHAHGLPAALNAAAASVLEARHGPESRSLIDVPPPLATDADSVYADDDELPPELRDSPDSKGGLMGSFAGPAAAGGGGWLGSRWAKVGLGALALLLIVGGLSLFGAGSDDGEIRYRTVEQRPVESGSDAERLELVDEQVARLAASDSDGDGSVDGVGDDSVSSVTDDAEDATTATDATTTESDPEAGDTPDPVAGNESRDASDFGESEGSGDAGAEVGGTDSGQARSAPADTSDDASGDKPDDTSEASSEESPVALSDNVADGTTNESRDVTVDETPDPPPSDEALLPADTDAAIEAGVQAEVVAEEAADESTSEDNDDDVVEVPSDAPASSLADREVPENSPVRDPSGPLTGALESPNWILVQKAGQWTVQMSASTDRESVEQFLARAQLQAPNSIYSFTRSGRTWYALVHGLFPSIDAARDAIDKMPAEATSNQPWIRAVGRIQRALKESN